MLIQLLKDHLDHKAGSVLDLAPADAGPLLAAGFAAPPPPAPPFADFLAALATKSLAATAGPTGGYLVPAEHSTRIFALAASISLVRPRATVLPMTSRELEVPLPDYSTPADAVLTALFARALAWHADRAFLRGTGVGQPLGILSADATTSVGAAAGANDPHRRVGRRTKSGGV